MERIERENILANEYRTRLIADVVTGKLDVRDASLPDLGAVAEPDDPDDLNGDLSAPEENSDD
jgi:type I restriction enzyme S subunit